MSDTATAGPPTAKTAPSVLSKQLAAPHPTSYTAIAASLLSTLTNFVLVENPLVWTRLKGRKNERADVLGPYYLYGAPNRNIDVGKGVVATVKQLKQYVPFLLTVRITSPSGKPLQGATLDWWQADTGGAYYFADYTLRGRVTTDAHGYADVLAVPPGKYGPGNYKRAGHVHLIVHPPKEEAGLEGLTTQMYVCKANDVQEMRSDFINLVRSSRHGNMVHCWSIAANNAGGRYMAFPELDSADAETAARVAWWDGRLAEVADGLKVVAGARTEITLSEKSGWF